MQKNVVRNQEEQVGKRLTREPGWAGGEKNEPEYIAWNKSYFNKRKKNLNLKSLVNVIWIMYHKIIINLSNIFQIIQRMLFWNFLRK